MKDEFMTRLLKDTSDIFPSLPYHLSSNEGMLVNDLMQRAYVDVDIDEMGMAVFHINENDLGRIDHQFEHNFLSMRIKLCESSSAGE